MLPGYVDQCVNRRITAGLRLKGLELVTAQERKQCATDDQVLLEVATAENRLLLTNDADFLRLHKEWMTLGKSHSGIVYWPQSRPIGTVIRAIIDYVTVTEAEAAKNTVKFV
jgi:hypothetical protein